MYNRSMNTDSEHIKRLIAQGETFTTEFKSDRGALSDHELVEAVVCLANGEGGTLLLGVEDDGEITGLDHKRGVVDAVQVQALLMNQTMPSLSCQVTLVNVDDWQIAVVDVPRSRTPVGTRGGTYKRRALRVDGKPECVPYSLAEMLSQAISVGDKDYALLPVPGLTWHDLDPAEFARFRQLAGTATLGADASLVELSDIEIARALRVVAVGERDPEPLMGALLLFGRVGSIRRFAPTHEVFFQVSEDLVLGANDDLTAGLLAAADSLFAQFRQRNSITEVDAGLVHLRIPLVPERAFREAVANALVHRDYTRMGAVRVAIDSAGVTVSSPGGFVEGVRVDNVLDQSKPRSPVLADAFKRAGIVERAGLGVRRMFEDVIRVGRPAPDYSRTSSTDVIVRFDTDSLDIPLLRYFFQIEQEQRHPIRLADLLTLQWLRHSGKISLAEAAELTQQSRTQTLEQLTRLVEAGLIERRGSARSQAYHLSAATFRALDEPSAYVRIQGFDKVQQAAMIKSYVAANGSISRSQAADLCRISPVQATALLRSLADSEELMMVGSRRGSRYVPNQALT